MGFGRGFCFFSLACPVSSELMAAIRPSSGKQSTALVFYEQQLIPALVLLKLQSFYRSHLRSQSSSGQGLLKQGQPQMSNLTDAVSLCMSQKCFSFITPSITFSLNVALLCFSACKLLSIKQDHCKAVPTFMFNLAYLMLDIVVSRRSNGITAFLQAGDWGTC